MERAEFLEFVLGKQTQVVLETWNLAELGPNRVKRFTVDFEQAATGSFPENTFFLPQNGTIMSIMSDTDDREPALPPSVVIETGLGRRNSIWRFQAPISRAEASIMLSYLDPLSPPRMTDTYRLPGTVSTKHGEPFTCRIVEANEKIYTQAQVFGLQVPEEPIQAVDPAWIREPGPFVAGSLAKALVWMQRKSDPVAKSVRLLMEKRDTTPRKLMLNLLRSGLTEREAVWCAEAAAGNPYKPWVYGVREELAKILIIARSQSGAQAVANQITQIRGDRTDKNRPFVIRNKMAKVAMDDFEKNCTVLRSSDGGRWAIDRTNGTAMELIPGSEPIKHFISKRYGINPVDIDHRHLLEEMMALASTRPNTAEATSLSYYQESSNRMLVNFGGREVVALTKDGTELQENGADGVIFRPVPGADLLATKLLPVERMLQEPAGAWWDRLVPIDTMTNIVRGDPEHLRTLLHVWAVFFMFRNIAASRPIISCLGAAGSGKTTLSKKIHLLFYGKGVKLFQIKNQDSWTTTTSNYPLALFDNVDTPTPWWLPPALALAITPTDAAKRTLYSNNTPYIQRMDAMIGLSSHDASFLKDDVIDRMILLQFARIPNEDRMQEAPMLSGIIHDREELLGGLFADIIRVLNTPRPEAVRGSAIRIVDFMAIGQWIARALGRETVFMEALGSLSVHQTAKVLEEDIGLVTALEDLQQVSPLVGEWVTHAQIWNEIIQLSEDGGDSIKQQYRNQQAFGRKLLAIYTQLHETIGLEEQDDPQHGWKVWRLPKPKAKPRKDPQA